MRHSGTVHDAREMSGLEPRDQSTMQMHGVDCGENSSSAGRSRGG
jgi:hypothetical protein